jgi:outer membrane protein assembly factor BamB
VLHHRQNREEIVEAINATSGETIWRHADQTDFIDPYGYNNGPRCTPLLTSTRCYTFGAEGRLLCLDLADGSVVWQRRTAVDWDVPQAFFGVGSTPLLEGDKLIVMVGGQPNSGVVAFDAATGETLWESVGRATWDGVEPIGWRSTKPYEWKGTEKIASYASPVVMTVNGHRHLLCVMRQGLVSLNPADGRLRFKRWFRAEVNESVNAMTPVVLGDIVFISNAYYRMGSVLLRVSSEGDSFTEVWRSPEDRFARDPVTRGFEEPVLEAHWSTPILHKGFLYAFGGRNEPDATFRCLDIRTGQVRWNQDESWRRGSGRQPSVYGRGSLILADGKLIALGEGGRLGMFQPDPRQPEEICAWQVPQLRYPCWTAPVLANKRLYLRSEDLLLCFDFSSARSGQDSSNRAATER